MRAWRTLLFFSPLLAAGCVPYAGYYYQPYPATYPPYPQAAAAPGAECRPVSMRATIDGRPENVVGTVCKGPDGTWHVQPDNGPPGVPAP